MDTPTLEDCHVARCIHSGFRLASRNDTMTTKGYPNVAENPISQYHELTAMQLKRKNHRTHNGHIPEDKRYIKSVSVLGYSKALKHNPLYKDVVEVTKLLARHGYDIVNGGGPGVMEAATVGAHAGGGKAIGVTFYPKDISIFEGRSKENKLDREIITRNYLERTLKLLEFGDAYIIFNGGSGTISEFGMAWGLARLYFGHHKPFILYGAFWNDILSVFAANMLLRPEELLVYKIAETPEDVLRELEEFEQFVVLTHLQDKTKRRRPFSL